MSATLKPEHWLPVTVFLSVSVPCVWLLNALDLGGDYRVWLAIALGMIATGYAQNRLSKQAVQREGEQA